jgi:hypothetical protein
MFVHLIGKLKDWTEQNKKKNTQINYVVILK